MTRPGHFLEMNWSVFEGVFRKKDAKFSERGLKSVLKIRIFLYKNIIKLSYLMVIKN